MEDVASPSVPLEPDVERRLRMAGGKAAEWTRERDRLICEAFAAGGGLREIARAAGLSHPGVRRILVRDGYLGE